MSTFWKAVLSLIVIVAVVWGIIYMTRSKTPNQTANNTPTEQTPTSQTKKETTVDEDLTSIDVQLNAVDTDSASVDQSLNDKPVAQTE